MEITAKSGKVVLLCAIAGAHLLLLWSLDMSSEPGLRKPEEAADVLFFIEIPEPEVTTPRTPDVSPPRLSIVEPRIVSEAASQGAITLIPESGQNFIDWDSEARRVAGEAAARRAAEENFRSLDRSPAGMGPPPPKSSRHKAGDTQRFEGGEILTWINDRCYYTNQNYSSPYWAGSAFGSDLRLQRPVCKGGASGEPQMTFEEWRKKKGDQ